MKWSTQTKKEVNSAEEYTDFIYRVQWKEIQEVLVQIQYVAQCYKS